MDNLARKDEVRAAAVRPRLRVLPAEGDGRLYTYGDYETWDDDIRREIIAGKVYLMSAIPAP